jgi:hypothetical protein
MPTFYDIKKYQENKFVKKFTGAACFIFSFLFFTVAPFFHLPILLEQYNTQKNVCENIHSISFYEEYIIFIMIIIII